MMPCHFISILSLVACTHGRSCCCSFFFFTNYHSEIFIWHMYFCVLCNRLTFKNATYRNNIEMSEKKKKRQATACKQYKASCHLLFQARGFFAITDMKWRVQSECLLSEHVEQLNLFCMIVCHVQEVSLAYCSLVKLSFISLFHKTILQHFYNEHTFHNQYNSLRQLLALIVFEIFNIYTQP